MRFLLRLYQYVNVLSLDVVAGAVIGALFFGRLFEVTVSVEVLAALALTVWIIYTLDHLRDAMFIETVASTDRHRFHQKYFRVIAGVVIVVALADLAIIWLVPPTVLWFGLGLWFIVVLYLVFQRYLKFLKEFFVACLYTAGILLPSLALQAWDWQPAYSLIVAKYFITAWMNLLLFSLIDYNEDRQQQQHSFVTWFGPTSTRYGIVLLGLLNIASGVWLLGIHPLVAGIFIAMNSMLLIILFCQKYLVRNNYYRITGDAVFFIPLVYLL